ncbi:FtsX-like permease family protein [Catellatospora coxensis]|uniref:FtsX-like permease family protein n=1 Tax=Catellatospora coxensis TaxID=310354 RepID=UPI0031DE3646
MRPGVLVRLAVAGTRTDRVRVALTIATATLATVMLLVAATVLAVDVPEPRYQVVLLNHFDLRQTVAATLLLVSLPVLALAAQAGRIGAPARQRRLAALRLAGATPRQVVTIAAAETGVAAALGAGLGLAACLAGRVLLHQRNPDGRLWLPTDVSPWPWLLVLILVGLPVAAASVAALLLRHMQHSPLGVARAAETPVPKPWPLLFVPLGFAVFAVVETRDGMSGSVVLRLFFGGAVTAAGLVLGMAWLSHQAGRLLHRVGRGPATLLAARRLTADPWSGSRTVGVLLVCGLVAGGGLGMRDHYAAQLRIWLRHEPPPELMERVRQGEPIDPFFASGLKGISLAVGVAAAIAAIGVLTALLEAVAARRRAFATLTAAGVRRRVLAQALLWQAVLPVALMMPAAVLLGAGMVQQILPEMYDTVFTEVPDPACTGGACRSEMRIEYRYETWFVDWTEVALVSAAGIGLVALIAGLAAATLRTRTDLQDLRTA